MSADELAERIPAWVRNVQSNHLMAMAQGRRDPGELAPFIIPGEMPATELERGVVRSYTEGCGDEQASLEFWRMCRLRDRIEVGRQEWAQENGVVLAAARRRRWVPGPWNARWRPDDEQT